MTHRCWPKRTDWLPCLMHPVSRRPGRHSPPRPTRHHLRRIPHHSPPRLSRHTPFVRVFATPEIRDVTFPAVIGVASPYPAERTLVRRGSQNAFIGLR